MGTYAIGDVQGCFETLERLLRRIDFRPGEDRLWLAGDLVNRGPASLEVLRWARDHDEHLVAVLGNHDLHLLAVAAGLAEPRRSDTLDACLAAPDREALLGWLRRRPLLHREGRHVLVHAGLLPAWSIETAQAHAREVAHALREGDGRLVLASLAADKAAAWSDELTGTARISLIVAALTRLRICTADGRMRADFSGPPSEAPEGCRPWFDARVAAGEPTIVFGHWAALGLHLAPHVLGLDTGCVWGGSLTAIRLEDRAVFQEPAAEAEARPPARRQDKA